MAEEKASDRVFISHGHNETVKLKLRTFIKERLRLDPIVLAEQPDLGLTVIEKLEKYGKGSTFALIVLTADDETTSGGARARQNVIHELGFFHGILGRDKVLLLKQDRVELFSNISGLIYKEFKEDKIESVFEDIRLALETGSAQQGGDAVPKATAGDISQLVAKSLNIIATEWPKLERESLKKGITTVVAGLPYDMHVRRIKAFLGDRRREYEERLAEAEAEAESSKALFQLDPDHGGKAAAMSMAIFSCAAPRSAIRLIDQLVAELSFLESEGVSPNQIVDRLVTICESG